MTCPEEVRNLLARNPLTLFFQCVIQPDSMLAYALNRCSQGDRGALLFSTIEKSGRRVCPTRMPREVPRERTAFIRRPQFPGLLRAERHDRMPPEVPWFVCPNGFGQTNWNVIERPLRSIVCVGYEHCEWRSISA